MSDKRISELTSAASVDGTEVIPLVQGGSTKRGAISLIKDYIAALYSAASGSSLVGFIQSGSGTGSRDMQEKAREIVSIEDFYETANTGDADAWLAAIARLSSGGMLFATDTAYDFDKQVTVTAPANAKISIHAMGSEITTSGAISGLKITGGSSTGGVDVHGLKINHRGNSDATYGFDIIQAWRAHLYDCFVEAHGVSATYAAYHIGNGEADDPDTGSFWTHLIGCGCRKRAGADSGNITIGVLLEGAANATNIIGGQYGNTTTGVKVTVYSGETYLANGLLIDGAHFETYTTAIHVDGATTSNIAGHRFVNNRFESGTTVFSYTTTTTQPSVPPYLAGNHLVSSAGTYLNNPNSLYVNSWDFSVTPANAPAMVTAGTVKLRNTASSNVLELVPAGNTFGFKMTSVAAVDLGSWVQRSGGGSSLKGGTNLSYLSQIGAIGLSATEGKNFRNRVTFASAATAAVTFSVAEPDTAYFIALGPRANETFWITSPTTAGFTLNSSNATSTAVVDWIIVR